MLAGVHLLCFRPGHHHIGSGLDQAQLRVPHFEIFVDLADQNQNPFFRKRLVRSVMQPGMPMRGNPRAVHRAFEQDPAFFAAMKGGFPGPVIPVAEFVDADIYAVQPSVK